jgi:hypothetical protein
MFRLFFIFLFVSFTSTFGQVKQDDLAIKGSIKILFGLELQTPTESLIELLPNHVLASTDSKGNFQFSGLKNGTYFIKVLNFKAKPDEIKIELKDKSVTDFKIIVQADCEVNSQIAESDIRNKKPRLFLNGGIAPTVYFEDTKIEKKFKFKYEDFGCLSPEKECLVQYNETIFGYFDKIYGLSWRNQVRQDIVGLK